MMLKKTLLLFLLGSTFFTSCKKHEPITPVSDHYEDGEVNKLIFNTQNGVNIVIIGDGFTKNDLKKGGSYDTQAKLLTDYLFTIPPYKQYKKYFNTYMVYAESKKSGLNANYDYENTDTKFNAYFSEGDVGLLLPGNYKAIDEYVSKAVPRAKANIIILMVNAPEIDAATGSYDGIITLATGQYAKYVVIHELGHSFATLGDEYVLPEIAENYPLEMIESLANIDTTNDPKKVKWSNFLNNDAYKNIVGTYQGGYYRANGIYRPEETSVMREATSTQHYNAPSRLAIVKRIYKITGMPFDLKTYLQNDAGFIQPTFINPIGYTRPPVNDFIGIKEKTRLIQKQEKSPIK